MNRARRKAERLFDALEVFVLDLVNDPANPAFGLNVATTRSESNASRSFTIWVKKDLSERHDDPPLYRGGLPGRAKAPRKKALLKSHSTKRDKPETRTRPVKKVVARTDS